MKKNGIIRSLAAFVAVLVLSACGGGDGGSGSLSTLPPGDRIEPLDTAGMHKRAALAPPGARSRLPGGAELAQVALGPLPAAASGMRPKSGLLSPSPLKIGEGRAIPQTSEPAALSGLLEWWLLDDGAHVAGLQFRAEGARALRLGMRMEEVPEGLVLRFQGENGVVTEVTSDQLLRLRSVNVDAGLHGASEHLFWGPDTPGAMSTLEIQLPAGADPAGLALAVPQLSHLEFTVADAVESKREADIGAAADCNLDVMCSPQLDFASRSVAKMMFTRGGSTFLCTGTLMNDASGSRTDYLLTAAHCIDNSDGANSLITYWFFRARSCNSSPQHDPRMTRLTGGAEWLFSDVDSDSTLLQLNEPPPEGVVYAGSYYGDGVVEDLLVETVHHPGGDLQKASFGTVRGFFDCPGDDHCYVSDREQGGMVSVSWRDGITEGGTTEGGSSGAALFARSGGVSYVVGALHGGNASCKNPGGTDFYGRFSQAFQAGIRDWLKP